MILHHNPDPTDGVDYTSHVTSHVSSKRQELVHG
jgi:hypothetical protein